MGIQTVRLYKNTTSTIPIGVFTDVSDQFDLGLGTIINETLSETLQVSGLSAGTHYWFWLQCIDEAGNDSGILPLGSKTTEGIPTITGVSNPAVISETSIDLPNLSDFVVSPAAGYTLAISYEVFDNPWFDGSPTQTGSITAATPSLTVTDATYFLRYKATATFPSANSYESAIFDDPGNYAVVGAGFDHTSIVTSISLDPLPLQNAPVTTIFDGIVAHNFNEAGAHGWSVTTVFPGSSEAEAVLQLSSAKTLVLYRMWPRTHPDFEDGPGAWTMAGSTDGVSWTTIDTVTVADGSWQWSGNTNAVVSAQSCVGDSKTFRVSTPGSYSFYRLLITDNSHESRNAVCVNELQLFFN